MKMKTYKLFFDERYIRDLKRLDKTSQKRITKWINVHLLDTVNPYFSGKSLTGNLKGYWRYRIGDYRLIVEIRDEELVIVAINIGHRKEVYR